MFPSAGCLTLARHRIPIHRSPCQVHQSRCRQNLRGWCQHRVAKPWHDWLRDMRWRELLAYSSKAFTEDPPCPLALANKQLFVGIQN